MITKKLTQHLTEIVKLRQPQSIANFNEATWPGWARMAKESLAETLPHKTVSALAVQGDRRTFVAIRSEPGRGPGHFVVYEAHPGGRTLLILYQRLAADDWRNVETHAREDADE